MYSNKGIITPPLLFTQIRLTDKLHFIFSTQETCPGSELLSMSAPQRSKLRSLFRTAEEQSIFVTFCEWYFHISAVSWTTKYPAKGTIQFSSSHLPVGSPARFVFLPVSTRRNHMKDIVFVSSTRETKVHVNGRVFRCFVICLCLSRLRNGRMFVSTYLTYWRDFLLDSVYINI